MTLAGLRAYLADPAKDGSPAILAARELLDERDRYFAQLAKQADREVQVVALRQEVAELAGDVASYRRENERLRTLLSDKTPAPWEAA